MAVRTNMGGVAAFGETLAEGCYHFRIDKIEDDGGNSVRFYLKCQTEPYVGRTVFDNFQMDNSTALSKLKAYYDAVHYDIGEDGAHDPSNILGGEFFACIKHNVAKGTTFANIVPWTITSMEQGPAQTLGPSATT